MEDLVEQRLMATNFRGIGELTTVEFLKRNFERHYQGNRAPFPVALDTAFLDPLTPLNKEDVRE